MSTFSMSWYSPISPNITLEFEPDELGGEGLGAEPEGKYKDEG